MCEIKCDYWVVNVSQFCMKTGFLDKLLERVDRMDSGQVQGAILRLVRERGFMESVFQTMLEGVLILDLDGTITYLNNAASELFGIDEEQAVGNSLAGKIRGLNWESLVNERRVMSRDLEVTYPDHRFLNFYLAPIGGEQDEGELVGYVMLVRDVTADRKNEVMKTESDQVSMLTLLAAGVAHELGNPLNSVTIHLQLLERKMRRLPAEVREELGSLVTTARDEIKRLDTIIDQFLTAVRPSRPQLAWCDIAVLIEEAARFLQAEFDEHGCELNLDIEGGLPSLELDPTQMKQALYNVMRNAMQAASGEERPKVLVTTHADDSGVVIAVRDNGPGIDPEHMGKVFQPYFTTKAGGTGLGLLIVRRIVRDHGGDITLDSSRGDGMVVSLSFPFARPRVRYLAAPAGDDAPDERRSVIDVEAMEGGKG